MHINDNFINFSTSYSCLKQLYFLILFFRFNTTYNKISIFIMRNRKSVDVRFLQRLQFNILSRELSSTLPAYQLITSQTDIQSFVSLRHSFKLHVTGFVKRVDVDQFVSALRSFWTSRLPGSIVQHFLIFSCCRCVYI